MRIPDSTFQAVSSRALEKSQARVLAATERASTGTRVLRASDDPVAVSRLTLQDAALEKLSSMQRSADAARVELIGADQALGEADTLLSRVRAIAVLGSSAGMSASDQATLAAEVDQLRQALFGTANAEQAGTYLFGGHQTDLPPFESASYAGDSGVRRAEVAPGKFIRTGIAGDLVFSTPVDLFSELEGLATDLRAGDADAVASRLATLDAGHEQVIQARAGLGVSFEELSRADDVRIEAEIGFLDARQRAVGSDFAAGALELVEAQNAMRAAIAVATRMLEGLQPNVSA
ncbi:MAG: flagellar hook-associated protein FlgL [Deltaproteobacteria bacterium]|nr:flagellar hook-associated protein FlgL [Deltaproteobacteria bacterium]